MPAASRSTSAPPSPMSMTRARSAPSPSWASTRPTAHASRSAGSHPSRAPCSRPVWVTRWPCPHLQVCARWKCWKSPTRSRAAPPGERSGLQFLQQLQRGIAVGHQALALLELAQARARGRAHHAIGGAGRKSPFVERGPQGAPLGEIGRGAGGGRGEISGGGGSFKKKKKIKREEWGVKENIKRNWEVCVL